YRRVERGLDVDPVGGGGVVAGAHGHVSGDDGGVGGGGDRAAGVAAGLVVDADVVHLALGEGQAGFLFGFTDRGVDRGLAGVDVAVGEREVALERVITAGDEEDGFVADRDDIGGVVHAGSLFLS